MEKTLISMEKSEGKETQRHRLEDLHIRQHMKPSYKPSTPVAKKKFDFAHMRVSKYADIRKYIAVPGTKDDS